MFKKIVWLGLAVAAVLLVVNQWGQEAEPDVAEVVTPAEADRSVSLGEGEGEQAKAMALTPKREIDQIESVAVEDQLLPEPVRAVLQGTPLEQGVSNKAIVAPEPPLLVVPESYSVDDAAKYYLPPEQRSSGNLGGPPPLPDVSNAQNGIAPPAGLAPPVAPAPE